IRPVERRFLRNQIVSPHGRQIRVVERRAAKRRMRQQGTAEFSAEQRRAIKVGVDKPCAAEVSVLKVYAREVDPLFKLKPTKVERLARRLRQTACRSIQSHEMIHIVTRNRPDLLVGVPSAQGRQGGLDLCATQGSD